jgi:hypothetical protein
MLEPRVNASSIRYSDKVKGLVTDAPGESFADKFEFIVLTHYENMERRSKELLNVQRQIETGRAQLEDIRTRLKTLHEILNNTNAISRYIQQVEQGCNTFIEQLRADPSDQGEDIVLHKGGSQ